MDTNRVLYSKDTLTRVSNNIRICWVFAYSTNNIPMLDITKNITIINIRAIHLLFWSSPRVCTLSIMKIYKSRSYHI